MHPVTVRKNGEFLTMVEQSIIKINEFCQILNELVFSYIEYEKKYHKEISGVELDYEWLKEEMCKHGLTNPEDFYDEILIALDEFSVIENEARILTENGNNASSWLYSLIRPDFNDDDENYRYVLAMHKLFDIYNQSCIARNIIQNVLPYIKGLSRNGNNDNREDVDENFVNNEANVIEEVTGINKRVHPVNPQVTNSVQKVLLQQYSQKMQLDVSYNMTASEMSICAMDDIAYHLSRNAALMGTGSLALSLGIYLGQSYIGSKTLELDNKIFNEALLRPGAKSGLRVALIGALKVGAARNALPIISGVASSTTLLGIATVGVECCDAMVQYAQQRIDALQAIDQVGRASSAGICSLVLGAQGAAVGTSALGMISVMPLMAPILGSTIALPIMGELIGGGAGIFVGGVLGKEVYEHTRRLAIFSENVVNVAIDAIQTEELWERSKITIRNLNNKVKTARIEQLL